MLVLQNVGRASRVVSGRLGLWCGCCTKSRSPKASAMPRRGICTSQRFGFGQGRHSAPAAFPLCLPGRKRNTKEQEKERLPMCFRPADASAGSGINKCPECGKTIQMMGGVTLKSCPFCKCDFTPYLDGTKPLPQTAPGALPPPRLPAPLPLLPPLRLPSRRPLDRFACRRSRMSGLGHRRKGGGCTPQNLRENVCDMTSENSERRKTWHTANNGAPSSRTGRS